MANNPQEEKMSARTPIDPGYAPGTNGNGKTAQSYIAGIGASGALLAGAVVAFVFLVGTVSFEVWPEASERDGGTESLGVAELSGPGSGASAPSSATLGETVVVLASSVPSVEVPDKPKADPGLKGGDGGGDEGGGDAPATPAPVGGNDDGGTADEPGGGGSGGNGSGGNPPSDRPTGARPDRPSGGGSGGGTAGAPAPPATGGGNQPSDRPSSGGRG